MTTRISNSKFITVLDPLPIEGLGWEAVAYHVGPSGDMSVMQRVYRPLSMTGSKVRNDFGSGQIVISKEDLVWGEPLPTPLVGRNPLEREFLWRFYEDGVLRHEFFGEDIKEHIATDGDAPRSISVGGRTPEIVLDWGVHVPAWAEMQTVTLDDAAEDGSFILTFGTARTKSIPHNATAAQFKNAVVNGVSRVSSSDLVVTKTIEEGQRKWHVLFVGQYVQGNAVPPGFGVHSSTVETKITGGGVQVVALVTDANEGSFILEFGTSESDPIAHNATAAQFKSALVSGISGVTNADLEVTRTTEDGVLKWRIKFVGAFENEEDALENPGLSLKSSNVRNGSNRYFPSVSSLTSGGTARYFPSVSEISQKDYYSDSEPRTAASAFLDALNRCQDRNILEFVTPLFSATHDSFNEAWLDNDVIEVGPGESLLSMMRRFSEAYGWEFRMMPGFKLQVVQNGFGVDRSPQVRFWFGGHQIKHELDRTSREILTRVWAQTNDNKIVQAEGSSPSTALAREVWIDGFEGDSSYAQRVANKTQAERAGQTKLRSVKFPYDSGPGLRLFEDFTYCDWIGVEDDRNVMHILKIESVAWSVGSESPIDFEVTFLGE